MNKRELEFYNRLDEVDRHVNPGGSGEPETFIPHPDFDPDEHDMDEAEDHINALAEGLRRMHESGSHNIFQHFATQMYQGRSGNAKDPFNQFDNASLEHLVHGAISALQSPKRPGDTQ